MVHRGPDAEGVVVHDSIDGRPPVTLVHRRLAIIDPTDRGKQPMTHRDGRFTITYNGEIYNYRDLRAELETNGEQFKSDCDTEVLLALYARYGRAALDRLNGMFAFAVWDAHRSELFLARDRLGVKPLYYSKQPGRFVFGSEIKAMLPALPRPRLRTTAVADYLTFLWVPDPDTLFDGIWKLPPGHWASFHAGRLEIKPYWDMDFAPDERGAEEWVPEVRNAVQAAVRRQMVSDVPLGAFLSGGIDSSAIVAEMSEAARGVTTYTVGFTPEDLAHEMVSDDLPYARTVGRLFGVDYHEEVLRPDVVDLLPRLVWHMDEPIGDPACISTYLICRAARERLKVVLSGMGGDEVFAGYPRHVAARYAQALDIVPLSARRALRAVIEERMTMGGPGRLRGPRRSVMKFGRGVDQSPEERYLIYSSYYRPRELRALLSGAVLADIGDHDAFRYHRQYFDRVRDQHWLNRLLYVDLKTFLPCLNLAYTDKMSMAASTEVRVPLLDDALVQMSARIPAHLKLRGTTRKYILKKSMEGILPRSVIHRPKAGFGAPVRAWVSGTLRPLVAEALSAERIASRGLFEPTEVARLIRANDAGAEDNALRIWALLTLEMWQQTFLDGMAPAA